MKKRLIIALVLLFLLSTYKPQKLFLSTKFNIKEIQIENNLILKNKEIKTNLYFLKKKKIEDQLKKLNFIESFEVKKVYPNNLKIKIFEKQPIAILQYKKEKFFINEKVDLINYIDLKNYRNLPIVFGSKDDFKVLYVNLKEMGFPLNLIRRYYSYESKRWDLETEKKQIIKLPVKNYTKSLKNFMSIKEKKNFDKYKVFDYRINNQLILK
jgi:cell division protein FtsQ